MQLLLARLFGKPLEWKSWQQLENKIAEAHKLCVCDVGVGELGQSEIPEVTECDGKLGVK